MPLKKCLTLFALLALMISCTKQEPKAIEQGFTETIERGRLEACARMNLFSNLFEKKNIVATFDCTAWSKDFPVLRAHVGEFNERAWDNLFLPISKRALNDRNVLKQSIAVTQVLEEQNGLDDLGNVITALSDSNFYDGMNELFSCAASEKCQRASAPEKNDIVDAFGILELLRQVPSEVQVVATAGVAALEELSSNFSREVMKVLTSSEFIKKRVEMLDLLVKFATQPRTRLERAFLPQLFVAHTNSEHGSLYTWLNSPYFGPQLFKQLIAFTDRYPLAVKDLRSLGQVRSIGLRCESEVNAGFYVNLDKHIYVLLNKIRELNRSELNKFLADDLSMHQLASQACPNFSQISVDIDGTKHVLDVVRMKKAMIDFTQIPGVYELTRIVANELIKASQGDEVMLGNFMAAQMSENYIGAGVDWLRIIDQTSPALFEEYSRYIKAFPATSFTNISRIVEHVVAEEQDSTWPAISKLWFFFTAEEKNFVFNYLDRHFSAGTNYKALFTYYLDIYSILMPSFNELVSDWRDNGKDVENFNGLKELAFRFHGQESLDEFKKFFSREHILKVIELFVNNGEQLTAWAQEVRAALPIIVRNQANFEFSSSAVSLADQCLTDLATNDLALLIKNFPSSCRPLEGQTLLEKISVLASLSHDFHQQHGYTPFVASGLLAPVVVQNFIVLVKKSFDQAIASGVSALAHLKWLKAHLVDQNVRTALNEFQLLLGSFPQQSSQRLQEKTQIELANYISDSEANERLSKLLERFARWRMNSKEQEVFSRVYPAQVQERSCISELNQSIGGTPCPNLEQFKSFVANFTELLARKNDESPLAVRQFLKALDPDAGFLVPYQGITSTAKNLSIQESLKMFWDLSDRSRAVNNKLMVYEDSSGKKEQNVTTMERIEVVIRDVNFDANYLGAHYKNSVAKSYDYLKVVDSKYDLFKICVGAGFCGKFMNRSEKKMARNAVAAFPSLMDVNRDGLAYGDYMKALLGSVVSSSSRASQISTIVRFRRDRDGFNIPWIQTKKQLRKHNGVILSELAGIGAFSNMARWTRDRFGRNENSFESFLKSQELLLISENFLKGFDASVSDKTLSELLLAINNSKETLVVDLWHWVNTLNYSQLRRVEDTLGDLLVIASSLSKNYPAANWDRLVQFATWGINNYSAIKVHWGEDRLYDIVASVQPLLEFVANGLIDEEELFAPVVTDLYKLFEKVFLDEADRVNVLTLIQENFNAAQAKSITKILVHSSRLIKQEWSYGAKDSLAGFMALSGATNSKNGGLRGFAHYLNQTANKRACRYEGELVYCQNNPHYLELNKLVGVVARNEDSWLKYVGSMFDNLDPLADWMTDSLGLIKLE